MKRSLTDIRENLYYVGCDNETARELCEEVERLDEAEQLLCKIFYYLDDESGNAPGHSHSRPGHWDADDSECHWCTTWSRVRRYMQKL